MAEKVIVGTIVGLIIGVLVIGVVILSCLAGAFFGAVGGWLISMTPLKGLVEGGFNVFGFNATDKLVHIGAMLGFVCGFLKGVVEVKSNKNTK